MSLALKYFQKRPNAGDQFSRVVAEHYFSRDLEPCSERPLEKPNLILLGSILEWADANSHICGAGLIASDRKLASTPARIHCVRGPLTAHFLERQGIAAPGIFGDPGILAPRFFLARHNKPETRVGIIPHYVDLDSPWIEAICTQHVRLINPLSPLPQYFDELQQCEVILSSSLHGLIFAHAFGKRALWIELTNRIIGNGFKFFDYYLSVGVSPEQVHRVPITAEADPAKLADRATWADQSPLIPCLEAALHAAKATLAGEIR